MGFQMLGIEFDRPLAAGFGLVDAVLKFHGHGQVVVGLRIVGAQFQDMAGRRLGLGTAATQVEDGRQIGVDRRILAVDHGGRDQMIRRQFQAARAVFDQSQKMQGLGLARAFGQDLGEGFFGLTEAARVVGLNPGGQARAASFFCRRRSCRFT